MTTLEQGFIEAICADPRDDIVRLIYADWLQDHGEAERAEFIRVQCELAEMPPKPERCIGEIIRDQQELEWHNQNCPKCNWVGNALRCRERELLEQRGFVWFREAFGYAGIGWAYTGGVSRDGWRFSTGKMGDKPFLQDCLFRRGFVEVVSCTCADWLQHGPQVVRAQPVLEVKLTSLHTLMDTGMTAEEMTGFCEHPVEWARGPHDGLEALPPL
jgi:uncharacterized protein (TIGR02996 family)